MTARKEWNAYRLADLADCHTPDSQESPGAVFLVRVADEVTDLVRDGQWSDDSAHEVADGAVPVYTYEMWETFVDVCAWQEDPTELGADGADMTAAAGVCLYLIADRLARAVAEEVTPDDDDDDDEGGES